MSIDPFVGAIVVAIVQVLVGVGNVIASTRALKAQNDLLAEITVGSGSVKIDKTDIIAAAFSVFIFWAVSHGDLTGQQGVGAFVTVLAGTGVKEFIEAVLPKTT